MVVLGYDVIYTYAALHGRWSSTHTRVSCHQHFCDELPHGPRYQTTSSVNSHIPLGVVNHSCCNTYEDDVPESTGRKKQVNP